MNDLIYDYILSVPLIDSNEFLPPFEELRPRRDIVAEILSDEPAAALTGAGLSPEIFSLARGRELTAQKKWELIAPYWKMAIQTPACRAAELAARELYGFDAINGETIKVLDESFRSTFSGDRYNYILKKRCNIEFAVLSVPDSGGYSLKANGFGPIDNRENCRSDDNTGEESVLTEINDKVFGSAFYDKRYFIPSNDIGKLAAPESRADVLTLGSEAGVSISAFDDYLEACSRKIADFAALGRVLSCAASKRLPAPRKTSYSDARNSFDGFMHGSRSAKPVALRRYMYRFLLERAAERRLTLRLDEDHTGCAEAGENDCFRELFGLFPLLSFDVLASAFPGRRELSRMAGLFPNVYANLSRAGGALDEYLCTVPYNKLIAFGGGCTTIDAVYGRALLTRGNLTRLLSEKISSGETNQGAAKAMARALLYDNAREIYYSAL